MIVITVHISGTRPRKGLKTLLSLLLFHVVAIEVKGEEKEKASTHKSRREVRT
jgi:hypothetical protein